MVKIKNGENYKSKEEWKYREIYSKIKQKEDWN
jgi:hypothetical protein